jgi:hypothetical protein
MIPIGEFLYDDETDTFVIRHAEIDYRLSSDFNEMFSELKPKGESHARQNHGKGETVKS